MALLDNTHAKDMQEHVLLIFNVPGYWLCLFERFQRHVDYIRVFPV